jgi:succinate dehydrogenase hydrophobic anchor subunit
MLALGNRHACHVSLTIFQEAGTVNTVFVKAHQVAAEIVFLLLIIYGAVHAGCLILRLVLSDLKSAQGSLHRFLGPRRPPG